VTTGFVTVAALLCTAAVPAAAVPAPVTAPAPASKCLQPTGLYKDAEPWPQRRFGLSRIWPLTTGEDITVAVLATGVDARHDQFADGQVLAGDDVQTKRTGAANRDCDGRGTFAAGLIAARPRAGTTFAGVAPGVRILPVRYTASRQDEQQTNDSAALARAVRYAIGQKARIIVVPTAGPVDTPALKSAVADAVRADIVVVSAGKKPGGNGGTVTYPTAYPDVLAVTAVDADGSVLRDADSGRHIVVAAPGGQLVGPAPVDGDGHVWPVTNPGMAAAFVGGVAALVWAYRPTLSAQEVVRRIRETSDPPRASRPDPQVGWGIVNPYAAVTSETVAPTASAVPVAGAAMRPAVSPDQPPSLRLYRASLLAAVVAAVAGVLVLGATVRSRARRLRRRLSGEPT
jgi:subtilisin family serine protease